MADLVDELMDLIEEDADHLGCTNEVQRARDIVSGGTSCVRQRAVYAACRDAGESHDEAMQAVAKSLIAEFAADL